MIPIYSTTVLYDKKQLHASEAKSAALLNIFNVVYHQQSIVASYYTTWLLKILL